MKTKRLKIVAMLMLVMLMTFTASVCFCSCDSEESNYVKGEVWSYYKINNGKDGIQLSNLIDNSILVDGVLTIPTEVDGYKVVCLTGGASGNLWEAYSGDFDAGGAKRIIIPKGVYVKGSFWSLFTPLAVEFLSEIPDENNSFRGYSSAGKSRRPTVIVPDGSYDAYLEQMDSGPGVYYLVEKSESLLPLKTVDVESIKLQFGQILWDAVTSANEYRIFVKRDGAFELAETTSVRSVSVKDLGLSRGENQIKMQSVDTSGIFEESELGTININIPSTLKTPNNFRKNKFSIEFEAEIFTGSFMYDIKKETDEDFVPIKLPTYKVLYEDEVQTVNIHTSDLPQEDGIYILRFKAAVILSQDTIESDYAYLKIKMPSIIILDEY